MSAAEPVLSVRSLSVEYATSRGPVRALNNVSFELAPGEVLGIVGETGCGKSTLAGAIPRLLPQPPAKVDGGEIRFQGKEVLKIPSWELPALRGTGVGMVLQEPLNSLNPAYRIFEQMAEALRVRHARERGTPSASRIPPGPFDYSVPPRPSSSEVLARSIIPSLPEVERKERPGSPREELRKEAVEYLRLVRINDPERILRLYPHELSGGMRQRVMIAMVLSERPGLLIADEPTSALDVTIQAQVLTLMKELLEEVRTSILFISHDLGVVAEIADRVGVMYAGHLVELGPVAEVFEHPRHPYTLGLLRSIPTRYKSDGPLTSLPGSVPNLAALPPGCPFAPRCGLARSACSVPPGPELEPRPVAGASDSRHLTACLFPEEVASIP